MNPKSIYHKDGSPCYVRRFSRGRLHNRFGPAVIKYGCCGTEAHELFYINGKYFTKKQHQNRKEHFLMNSTAFVLFLVFLILKLCNVIAWSWWWVTAPLWIGWTLGLIILFVLTVFIRKKQKSLLRDWPKVGRNGW